MDKKYLVVYSSLTGNTKKVGEAVVEALGADETVFAAVEENPSYEGYDMVVVGYWVDKGTADAKAKTYIESIKNAKVALFATLGADPKSPHGVESIENGVKLLDSSNEVMGTYICQGKIDPKVIEMMMKYFGTAGHHHSVDEKRQARHEAASTHPDEKDLAEAKATFTAIKAKLLGGN